MAQSPYGDIFLAATPALDKLSSQLYAEQKQRELDRKNQVLAMDNEFSKNVANIRDADVGDISKAYGDWKLSTQSLMKQKHGVNPQQQLEVLRKKADLYKMINESKSEKENEENIAKRYTIKPDDFIDNGGDLITKGRQLSIAQKKAYKMPDGTIVDLTNPQNLLYQDKTNWQPILQKAAGTPTQRGNQLEEATTDKLQTKVTTYKGMNSPLDYYTSVISTFNKPRSDEYFANKYQFTPEEAQVITDEFNRVKETPAFKAAYGDATFPESSNLTPGLRTAKLLAMQHAIHNQPTSSFTMKDNKEAIMTRQENFRKEQQARSAANSLARLYVYANIKDRTPENIGRNVDGLIGNMIEDARNHDGVVATDDETFKSITGHQKTPSLILKMDEAGNASYGKKDEKGNFVEMGKVPLDATKIKLTKTYKSGLDSKYNTGNVKSSEKPATNKKVTDPALLKLLNQK